MTAVLIIGGILLLAVISIAAIYNSLVTLRNRYKNSFSQIDVQLKRRYDLIPNLVETAKGYMKHERETLEAVINARNSALSRLFALAENYPDLKANENMLQLQEELTSTENRIAFARQAFNDSVTTYNIACEKFPHTIIAGMFNFSQAQLLESIETSEERKAPKVSF